MRGSLISIVIYDYPEDNPNTLHKAVVSYTREDNDLLHGTIVETSDKEWSEKNYRKIAEFADKELRSLGVYVR